MGAIQNSINQALGTAAGAAYGVKRTIAEEAQAKALTYQADSAADLAKEKEFADKANISESSYMNEKAEIQKEIDNIGPKAIKQVQDKLKELGLEAPSESEIAFHIASQRAEKSRLSDPVRNIQYRYATGKIKNFEDYVEELNNSSIVRANAGFKPGDFEYDLAKLTNRKNKKEK